MASPLVAQVAGAASLFAGAAWMAPAFVPVARGTPNAGTSTSSALRGSAGPAADAAGAAQTHGGATALLGLTAAAVAASAVRDQRRRQPATSRKFFGGTAAPPPKEPTSYKDFNDPWLAAADLGFDPLNLAIQGGIFDKGAKSVKETTYYNYRESEVKHGRFAMAAFLAIFAESADRGALLHQLGQASAEDNLDGTLGLDEVQAPVLLIGLGAQALAEYNLQRQEDDGDFLSVEYKSSRMPGDLGFDPLGLGNGIGADKVGLHNIEINSGRLAMIGITSFLFKEFVVKDATLASKIL